MFIPLNSGNVGYLIFFQNICIKSPWYLHYTTMFFGDVTFLMAKYSTLFNRIQPPSPTIHLPFTNRVQTRGFTSPRSAQHRDPRAGTKWPQILGWHKASFVFAVVAFLGPCSTPNLGFQSVVPIHVQHSLKISNFPYLMALAVTSTKKTQSQIF